MSLRNTFLSNKKDTHTGDVVYIDSVGVESEIVDMMSLEAEIDADQVSVERMAEIAVSLEGLADFAQETCADGGLDRTGAMAVQIAAANTLAPLEEEAPVPSVESFGGTADRISSTQVSVEGLKEKAVQVWEAIKAQLKKLRAKIKTWFNSMTDSSIGLIKKAEKLKEVASKKNGTPEKDEIPLKAGPLQFGDKHAGKEVVAKLPQLKALVAAYVGSTKLHSEVEAVATAISDLDFGKDAFGGKMAKIAEEYAKVAAKHGGELNGGTVHQDSPLQDLSGKSDMTVAAGDKVLGNMCLYRSYQTASAPVDKGGDVETNKKALEAARKTQVRFDVESTKQEKADADDVKVLTTKEIEDLCDAVIDMLAPIKAARAGFEKGDKVKEKLDKAGDKLASVIKKRKDDDNSGFDTLLNNSFSDLTARLDQPSSKIAGHAIKVAAAALGYGQASLAQYKK